MSAFQFLCYSCFVNFLGFYFVFQVLLWLGSLGDQLETALWFSSAPCGGECLEFYPARQVGIFCL